jgi:putative DNA primase/helicase
MRRGLAPDPFAPIGDDPEHPTAAECRDDQPIPVLPVPAEAPQASVRHGQHGEASSVWAYRDDGCRLLGYVARFDAADGKEILPRTWCRLPDGAHGWRWKAFPEPRPLYGLDKLAAAPTAPVLVVEGEKTADAGQALFPDHVTVTWPGGSNAVSKADWSALTGREVILWPDADVAGRKAMEEIAAVLSRVAAGIALVPLPEDLPEGWDVADPVPEGVDLDALLATGEPVRAQAELPPGYALTARGLVWRDPMDSDKPHLLLAGPLEVLAETRDQDGGSWGVLLRWHDHDGRVHRLALPRAMLAGDGADARRALLDGGLYVAPNRAARERLTAFLVAVRSSRRVTATSRIGWHGSAFVLPDESIGAQHGEDLLLQGSGAIEHAFRQRGTLEEWQEHVARYARGNSRLLLALSCAFAAALVGPCEAESGGVHFKGASSSGKSTALAVAGSAWGGGEPGGYVRSWRATANGLEGVALGHCDALLCLDELAQLAAREAGEVAYMLANGSGKSRSARDGSARRPAHWRLLFLSSGEIGLADKVMEDGRRRSLAAGQQVRIVDVPADAGAGLGLFEELHGFPSAEALARHLRTASSSMHGTAARMFLARIAGGLAEARSAVSTHTGAFVARYVPEAADGQVQRVAQRFALIAAGGELAVAAGVLPWEPGEAIGAAARCFSDWLEARGGIEPAEIRDGIAQVRAFLHAHGMSRFVPAWEGEEQRLPTRDIAGFRKREGDGWDYYVTAPAWSAEVCAGCNAQMLAAVLADRDLLVLPPKGSHRAKAVNVPGHGKLRLYHLPARLLEAGSDD